MTIKKCRFCGKLFFKKEHTFYVGNYDFTACPECNEIAQKNTKSRETWKEYMVKSK